MRAWRVHLHTSCPRWLNMRCANWTIPCVGRDLLTRVAMISVSALSVSPQNTCRIFIERPDAESFYRETTCRINPAFITQMWYEALRGVLDQLGPRQ